MTGTARRRGPAAATATPMVTPVVLDVDTGVDDALALVLAATHPALDLRAVSCVAGNIGIDHVVANTLTVLEAVGLDPTHIPVARGADHPLRAGQALRAGRRPAAASAPHASPGADPGHGRDGLADLGWPRCSRPPDLRDAVTVLRDVLREESRPVTMVALGPLTNLARLLQSWPDAAPRIAALVWAGGTATEVLATSNAARDPAAATLALSRCAQLGVPVLRYAANVFDQVRVSRRDAEDLVAVGGRGRHELVGRLLRHQCRRPPPRGDGPQQQGGSGRAAHGTIGDAGAVCAVIDPAGLQTAPDESLVVADGLDVSQARVSVAVDAERYRQLFLAGLG